MSLYNSYVVAPRLIKVIDLKTYFSAQICNNLIFIFLFQIFESFLVCVFIIVKEDLLVTFTVFCSNHVVRPRLIECFNLITKFLWTGLIKNGKYPMFIYLFNLFKSFFFLFFFPIVNFKCLLTTAILLLQGWLKFLI